MVTPRQRAAAQGAVYPLVADELRERIDPQRGYRTDRGGEATYSDRLPSLKDLCVEFGQPAVTDGDTVVQPAKPLNHVTVQKALRTLVDEGLLLAVDRQGYYVRRYPRLRYNLRRISTPDVRMSVPVDTWLEDVRESGYSGRQVIHTETILASHRIDGEYTVGDLLRLPKTALVLARLRTRYIGLDPHGPATEPESLHDSYYPLEMVEGIEALTSGQSINTARLLTEQGYPQERFMMEMVSRMPTRAEADKLRLPKATPVMERITVAYTGADKPVYVQHNITAGNGTRLILEINHRGDE